MRVTCLAFRNMPQSFSAGLSLLNLQYPQPPTHPPTHPPTQTNKQTHTHTQRVLRTQSRTFKLRLGSANAAADPTLFQLEARIPSSAKARPWPKYRDQGSGRWLCLPGPREYAESWLVMGVGAVILPTFGGGLGTALWTLFLFFGSISERPSLHRIKITFAAAQGLHGLQSMILASISAFSETRISTGEGEKFKTMDCQRNTPGHCLQDA